MAITLKPNCSLDDFRNETQNVPFELTDSIRIYNGKQRYNGIFQILNEYTIGYDDVKMNENRDIIPQVVCAKIVETWFKRLTKPETLISIGQATMNLTYACIEEENVLLVIKWLEIVNKIGKGIVIE